MTDSGTSALRLALEMLARRELVPVALPGFSCFDVATASVGARVSVTFYDIDPRSLSPDLDSLEQTLLAGARAVVIAPLFGFPVDWAGIRTVAERHGATIVEDAAQAHGSTFAGKPPGSHGDLAVLSFGRGKGWTGTGGGALLGLRAQWVKEIDRLPRLEAPRTYRELRTWSEAVALWVLGRPRLYGIPRSVPLLGLGETRYRDPHAATAMARASAEVALRTSSASDAEVLHRQRNAAEYLELFRPYEIGSGISVPHPVPGGTSGYLRFPLIVHVDRNRLEGFLDRGGRRAGAEKSYPETLDRLAALEPFLARKSPSLRGSRILATRLITLPSHSRLTEPERTRLARAVIDILGEGRLDRETETGDHSPGPLRTQPPTLP